ncbi:MAG: hypothetical protein ACYDEY_13685 [Acidimicrobiales bacterium]
MKYEFIALVVGAAVVVVGIAPFIGFTFAATSHVADTPHGAGTMQVGRALRRCASHHDHANEGNQDRAAICIAAEPSHKDTLRCYRCDRSGDGGYASSILSSNETAGFLGRW